MANPMAHHRLLDQQTLHLPHNQDGSLNYTVLGNMMSATILGEVLQVSYIDHEYGKTRDQLMKNSDSDWKFCYKEKDVIVFRKKVLPSRTHCFLGRGVIDAPLSKVVDYVHKFHNRMEWDDFLVQIEVCKDMNGSDWLLYMAHEAKQCFFSSKRDFLYFSRTGFVDNKYIQTSMSVEDKEYPHRPPYIRGEIKIGSGWVIEKFDGSECSTLVNYMAHLDLKDLPAGIVDRVLRRQPMAIHHIRKRLTTPSKLLQTSNFSRSNTPTYTLPSQSMFEDTVPIDHYIHRDFDKSEDRNADSPMYPWVTATQEEWQRKKMEQLKNAATQPNGEEGVETKDQPDVLNQSLKDVPAQGQENIEKPRSLSSTSPASTENKSYKGQTRRSKSVTEPLPSSNTNPKQNDSPSSQQFPDFSSWTVSSGKEQTLATPSSSQNFPSFSSWKRQQRAH